MENKLGFWGGMFLLVLFLGVVIVLVQSSKKEDWLGFYYPSSSNLEDYTTSSHFNSLEECRDWADAKRGSSTSSDYECGLDCSFDVGLNGYQCKETSE